MTIKDIVGTVYGRMTILETLPRVSHNRKVVARCSCGTVKEVFLGSLRTGRTTSCGCVQKEATTTHGQSRNGHPLYRVWASMKGRCSDTTNPNYGGRGITVCPEWEQFEPFLEWALVTGYQPGLTIDRRKNDQGYSPGNCRWVNATTQSRNRRSATGATSQYIGVYWDSTRQVWVAQITVNKKKKTLGLHASELEAAITRDQFIVNNGLKDFQLNSVL